MGAQARRLCRPEPRRLCHVWQANHQPTPFQLKKKFGGGKSQKKAKGAAGGCAIALATSWLICGIIIVIIHFLNATGRLTDYQDEISDIVEAVIKQYENIHTLKPFDVVVAENKTRVNPGQGVGGLTSTAYELYLTLDLDEGDPHKNIKMHLAPIVAHELTHLLRAQAGLPSVPYCSLGDDVVGEGLADHLSLSLYPEQDAEWIDGLSKEDFERMKARFIEEHKTTQYDRIAWVYGAEYASIPYCAGYTLGYAVVKDYLKVNNKNIKDILLEDASEIIKVWEIE